MQEFFSARKKTDMYVNSVLEKILDPWANRSMEKYHITDFRLPARLPLPKSPLYTWFSEGYSHMLCINLIQAGLFIKRPRERFLLRPWNNKVFHRFCFCFFFFQKDNNNNNEKSYPKYSHIYMYTHIACIFIYSKFLISDIQVNWFIGWLLH